MSRCTCRSGFYGDFGSSECTRRRLGDNCTTQDDCVNAVNDSLCQTTNGAGKCVCRTGYLPGGVTLSECQKLKLKSFCYNPDDCSTAVANSTCANRSCECLSGFKEVDDGLCALRTIGDANCRTARDCTDAVENSECAQGECRCLSGFSVEGNGTLCVKRQIDSTCEALLDCEDAVDNSYCQNGSCQCTTGYYSSTDGSLCIPKKVGDDCTAHEECSAVIARGRCEDLRCSCTPEHDAHSDGQECVPHVLEGLGRTVVESTDGLWELSAQQTELRGPRMRDSHSSGPYNGLHRNRTVQELARWTVSTLVTDVVIVVRTATPRAKRFTVSTGAPPVALGPLSIGSECFFTAQCQKFHPNSTCNQTQGNVRTCQCPVYVSRNKTTCIERPTKLGHACSDTTQCADQMVNTDCSYVTSSCHCAAGHIAFLNGTGCHPAPKQLGHYCLDDSDCTRAVNHSTCDVTNNTCLCTYGYYESAPTSCHERDRLGEYKPVQPEPSVNCSNNKCDTWNNSICQKVNDVVAVCRCDYRHARKPADATCIPVQTYLVTLTIFQEAGRYDYIPLKYNESRFNEIAHRVTLLGIQKIFEGSQFSDRYVSSDVVSIDIVRDGQTDFRSSTRSDLKVKVTVLLHLTAFYLNATNPQHLYDTIVHSLNSSKPSGILGDSLLKVWNPYSSVKVADYDECAEKERNDCSKDANCLNTVGSFICICKPYFDDVSKRTNLRPGRNCSKREVKNSQDSDDYQCSSGICDTSVEYTILALTLFLLIVIIFITYEIIQRKQDFSARKLYEKFGTTKIRKLRQASMRRLQASKRKKREEKMQKRELAKKRKEEVKAEENKEKKIRKMSQKESKNKKGNKNAKNIEELNENRDAAEDQPVSIVYPPSLPFVDDETINADICNLPGSVNTSPDERLSRYVPYIEESPV
ncbi:hypothetical protein Btru_051014 [Bulinus truncatus]|nr:hypothetical protein Btru_051014 [Bulinus truncatus]